MKIKFILYHLLAAVCLSLMTACSLTDLNAVWKDPDYHGGKLDDFLIIGVSRNEINRRLFEDKFTASLKALGIKAVPSYNVLPTEDLLDEEKAKSKIKGLGYDAVLVTRLVDQKTKTVYSSPNYVPPSYYYTGGYYSYYSRAYAAALMPAYYSEYEVFTLETNLYDTQTEKMIWSGVSETAAGGSIEVEIDSLVKVIVKRLTDDGLI